MKRSQRFAHLCEFTDNQEQEAAKVLGECTQRLDMQQRRLQDLEQYRQEYARQITTAGSSGMSIASYQNMQTFMNNLNQAIEQQKAMLQQINAEYERKKQLWLEARSKNTAMTKITSHYKQEEERVAEKKLQREIDDRSARQSGGNR